MTEYLPASHAMQSDIASLPIVSRYVPGGQSRHVVIEDRVPGGQSRHVFKDDEPLMTEYLPASHAMQSDSASLPVVSRYVPSGHFRHVESRGTTVEARCDGR
jgi:hypothetical protein